MVTLAELETTTPEIRRIYDDWVRLRRDTDADPYDYQAFRQHVIFRGLPDPGAEQLLDFPTGPLDRVPAAFPSTLGDPAVPAASAVPPATTPASAPSTTPAPDHRSATSAEPAEAPPSTTPDTSSGGAPAITSPAITAPAASVLADRAPVLASTPAPTDKRALPEHSAPGDTGGAAPAWRRWALAGVPALVLGAALLWWLWRRRRTKQTPRAQRAVARGMRKIGSELEGLVRPLAEHTPDAAQAFVRRLGDAAETGRERAITLGGAAAESTRGAAVRAARSAAVAREALRGRDPTDD